MRPVGLAPFDHFSSTLGNCLRALPTVLRQTEADRVPSVRALTIVCG